MELPDLRPLLPFALALFMPAAFAQGAADATMPEPKTVVPAAATSLQFNSTFTGYRAYAEQAVGSWREANDDVGRIGGWRAYAKEAAQVEGAATGAASGTKSGHDHHGSQDGKP